VIDDGSGIPPGFEERVFEPGVTSKHLDPAPPEGPAAGKPHGSGLSLYHIRSAAVRATVCSRRNPTSVHAVFDTNLLPERSLQTRPRDSSPQPPHATSHRTSRSNLQATLKPFTAPNEPPDVYYASPSRILATLLQKLIIQPRESTSTHEHAERLGLEVSLRTVQRVLSGAVTPALALREDGAASVDARGAGRTGGGERAGEEAGNGAELRLGSEEIGAIQAILEGAARASYLEVGPLRVGTRMGAIVLRASVYEPEEIYDDR
jgi:hypothetical protein